jgi:hypothetical protein
MRTTANLRKRPISAGVLTLSFKHKNVGNFYPRSRVLRALGLMTGGERSTTKDLTGPHRSQTYP